MFKQLQEFPSYEINEYGDIRRISDGYSLAYEVNKGYKRVHLFKDGKGYHRLVHRLMAMTFLPNPNNLPTVDHLDRNKLNNDLSNLEWKSRTGQNLNRGVCLKGTNTGEANISYCKRDEAYVVQVTKDFNLYKKNFKTLPDAINFRNEIYKNLNIR